MKNPGTPRWGGGGGGGRNKFTLVRTRNYLCHWLACVYPHHHHHHHTHTHTRTPCCVWGREDASLFNCVSEAGRGVERCVQTWRPVPTSECSGRDFLWRLNKTKWFCRIIEPYTVECVTPAAVHGYEWGGGYCYRKENANYAKLNCANKRNAWNFKHRFVQTCF